MSNLNERLDKLNQLVQDTEFQTGKGLSNEVNIWMFCYDPKDEMTIRHFLNKMENNTSLKSNIISHNLYHVFLEICEDKNILSKVSLMEEKKGSKFLQERILKFATVEVFSEKMDYQPHMTGDVLVISGIGEVYPFMRIHSLLEKLQTIFDDIPVVVMYPGSYDGMSVKLFDEFASNQYYRAFNII